MRKYVLILVAVILSVPASSEVQVKYDKFKQQTGLVIGPGEGKPNPTLFVITEFSGKKPSGPPRPVMFAFYSTSEEWEYLNCHDTDLLIDEKPVHLKTDHEGSVGNGYVTEYIQGQISFDQFKKIASAKQVQVKICNTEFSLSNDDMTNLREILRLTTPAKTPSKKMQVKKLGPSLIYTNRGAWELELYRSDDGKKYLIGPDVVAFVDQDGTLTMAPADQFSTEELKTFIPATERPLIPTRDSLKNLNPDRGFRSSDNIAREIPRLAETSFSSDKVLAMVFNIGGTPGEQNDPNEIEIYKVLDASTFPHSLGRC